MPFELKPEAIRKDAALLISVPRDLRRAVEREAKREGASLSEVGRRALRRYFEDESQSVGETGP